MTGSFAGKVVLVTGGARGVGRTVVEEFAVRGAHVVVNHFHSGAAAHALVEELTGRGLSVQAVRASVVKADHVERMMAGIREEHGGLDVLVNNAARGAFLPLADLTEEDWRRTFDLNLHAVRRCCLAALPLLTGRPGASVVNLSSHGSTHVVPAYGVVGASKAAMESLSRYLAVEFAPHGVRVNVAGSPVMDNRAGALFPDAGRRMAVTRDATPWGRLPTERDLARLVALLASDDAGFVTGQTVWADGGLSCGAALHAPPPRREPERGTSPVAVVGTGLLVPGAGSPEEFWEVLCAGEPVLGSQDRRYPMEHFHAPDPAAPDRTYTRRAGLVGRPDEEGADAWIRHAALDALGGRALPEGVRTSVVVAAWADGTRELEEGALRTLLLREADGDPEPPLSKVLPRAADVPESWLPVPLVRRALAGLVPDAAEVLAVDAACSSGLYALDLAARDLRDGRADTALAVGLSLCTVRYMILFAKVGGLSRAGDVRAFDTGADGTLFSDAVAAVALKRLADAERDGDRVLAVLDGFGGSSDGRGRAISAPNPAGQRFALRRAREAAGTDEVHWIVAHATGTEAGDRAELQSLAEEPAGPGPVLCTSNKSLVGHGGWASGLVSVIHAVLGLAHGAVPAQARCTSPSPEVPDQVTVPLSPVPLPPGPRRVGVSAFGFGGINAHLLLADRTAVSRAPARARDTSALVLVGWSALLPGAGDSAEALAALCSGAHPRGFGERYPAPPFEEARMPPRTVRAVDRVQLMGLQLAARLVAEHGTLWAGVADTTCVIAAHSGPTRLSQEISVRCFAPALDTVLDAGWWHRHRDALRARVPQVTEDTLPGLLPSIVAGRIAARYDLHGPSLATDSGRAALTVAERYLRDGDCALALVTGVHGNTLPGCGGPFGVPDSDVSEGGFLLAVTTAGRAAREGWRVLAEVPGGERDRGGADGAVEGASGEPGYERGRGGADGAVEGASEEPGYERGRGGADGACGRPESGWCYGGADDVAELLRGWVTDGALTIRPASGAPDSASASASASRPSLSSRTDSASKGAPGSDASGSAHPASLPRAEAEPRRAAPGPAHPSTAPLPRPKVGPRRNGSGPARPTPLPRAETTPGSNTSSPAPRTETDPGLPQLLRYGIVPTPSPRTGPTHSPIDALPAGGCLVVVDDAGLAEVLRPRVRAVGGTLVVTDPDAPRAERISAGEGAVAALVRRLSPTPKHLRVFVGPARTAWPGRPAPAFLAAQEVAFLALRELRAGLCDGGSAVVCLLDPQAGGVAHPHGALFTGMVKSAMWDLPGAWLHALTTDAELPEALEQLVDASRSRTEIPVSWVRHGLRHTEAFGPAEEPPGADGEELLGRESVVVAVGGARGITSALLTRLAERHRCRLWVVGSSDLDAVDPAMRAESDSAFAARRREFIARRVTGEGRVTPAEAVRRFERLASAREAARTVDALAASSGPERVRYLRADITDPVQVRAVAERVAETDGAVDLLVNAAGLHHAGELATKSLAVFRRVRDVKLLGYHALREAFAAVDVRHWCNFGSLSGVVGLPGEIEYAAANDLLSAAARAGQPAEFTVAWTLWAESGMATRPLVGDAVRRRGHLSALTDDEGARHFAHLLTRPARLRPPGVVQIGAPERRFLAPVMPDLARTDVPSPPPGAFLGASVRRGVGTAEWALTFTERQLALVSEHPVGGLPTLPGTLVLALLAEAAEGLVPGARAGVVRDVRFHRFLRVRSDGRVRHTVRAGLLAPGTVRVTVTSDTYAADGRLLRADGLHCEGVVEVGAHPPGAVVPSPRPGGPALDPFYEPGSPIPLRGAFVNTVDHRTAPTGGSSVWKPGAEPDPVFYGRMALPSLLVDALARTHTLRPPGTAAVPVNVPLGLDRLELHRPADDTALFHAHPDGIRLLEDRSSGRFHAMTRAGEPVLSFEGLRVHAIGAVDVT
ncbi:SDR family oxidoreductase [Streptomyces sp. 4F14]|uniref:SDR family oxidoreductase n=1 Tax=Streptomyces sp. 4F14 TaxID=3394380 RepID=UPI003A8AED14